MATWAFLHLGSLMLLQTEIHWDLCNGAGWEQQAGLMGPTYVCWCSLAHLCGTIMDSGARAENPVWFHYTVFSLLQNWRRNLSHSQDKLESLLMRIYIPDSNVTSPTGSALEHLVPVAVAVGRLYTFSRWSLAGSSESLLGVPLFLFTLCFQTASSMWPASFKLLLPCLHHHCGSPSNSKPE